MADVWSARDRDLLSALQDMWADLDPPPTGLAEDLIAALAAAEMDDEWDSMRIVRGDLTGVRSSSEVSTLEFDLGAVSLVVRLAPESPTTRRLDGWLSSDDVENPVARSRVVLLTDSLERDGVIDENGRFSFDGIRGHRWRLRFLAAGGTRRLQTPDLPLDREDRP